MSSLMRRWRRLVGVTCLYALMATAMLSPIASNDVIPELEDMHHHTGLIVQARMAIEEGQFPIRVAPWQTKGSRYPVYQYYSQLPYTIGGLLHRHVFPSNPYIVLKLLIWAALMAGGVFTFRAARRLTGSMAAGVIGGAVYLTAPYCLVNIHGRGAFTEAIAQGLLPMAVFYTLRCYVQRGVAQMLKCGLSWFALGTTHIITFVYGSCFVGLLVLLLTGFQWRRYRRLSRVGIGYALGWGLGLYFLWPVATAGYLVIGGEVRQVKRYLTRLPALLSPVSVPPEPQPGLHEIPRGIHPAVGWPILCSAGVVLYALIMRRRGEGWRGRRRQMAVALLLLFALAFFMTWSPINFWSWLPRQFAVLQFSYRLLAQVSWMGAFLSALGVSWLFRRRLDGRHVVAVLLILGATSGSYLSSHPSSPKGPALLMREPHMGYGTSGLFCDVNRFREDLVQFSTTVDKLRHADGWVWLGRAVEFRPWPLSKGPTLRVTGNAPDYLLRENSSLIVLLNGREVGRTPVRPGLFSWDVSLPISEVSDRPWSLAFRAENVRSPREIDPQTTEDRELVLELSRVDIFGPPGTERIKPLEELRRPFRPEGDAMTGNVTVRQQNEIVPIPVLYYPGVLDVRVDGKPVDYHMAVVFDVPLVAVHVPAGEHVISARFVGIRWANHVSLWMWIAAGAVAAGRLLHGAWVRRPI